MHANANPVHGHRKSICIAVYQATAGKCFAWYVLLLLKEWSHGMKAKAMPIVKSHTSQWGATFFGQKTSWPPGSAATPRWKMCSFLMSMGSCYMVGFGAFVCGWCALPEHKYWHLSVRAFNSQSYYSCNLCWHATRTDSGGSFSLPCHHISMKINQPRTLA